MNKKLFGIIGTDISHSLSPAFFKAGFSAIGFNAEYKSWDIGNTYEDFELQMESLLSDPDFCGCSVTSPHKNHLVQFAINRGINIEPSTKEMGCANTLIIKEGKIFLRNTDNKAIRTLVCLDGCNVAIIGTGAMASNVVHIAVYDRCNIVKVFNTRNQMTIVAQYVNGVRVDRLANIRDFDFDVIINCSPLENIPINPTVLTDKIFMDVCYHKVSNLKDVAKTCGRTYIGGLELFKEQAKEQFALFTTGEWIDWRNPDTTPKEALETIK